MEPKQGDRIDVLNIPKDYHWRDLYQGQGIIDNNFNGHAIGDTGNVCFYMGHLPYKDHERFSCSGSGNSVKADRLKFIGKKPATFWQFKDGIRRAHNAEHYEEIVSVFEIEFNDIN